MSLEPTVDTVRARAAVHSLASTIASAVRTQPGAVLGAAVLLTLTVLALSAPVISEYGVDEVVGDVYQEPSWSHPLGLDDAGIDMLTLMLWGARVSLLVGFVAALITTLIGGAIGLVAGYFGGKIDILLMRMTDYAIALPDIPLMLVAAAVWGRSLRNIIIIIGVLYWARTARLVRAQTKSVRERAYVQRARSQGIGDLRILLRHILPQLGSLLAATAVLAVGTAIFAEAAIAFLGLGDPALTSWGRLIQNAFNGGAISLGAWWAIVPPGLAVALVVLACTLIGRALDEALNPRLRAGHLAVDSFRMRTIQADDHREREVSQ